MNKEDTGWLRITEGICKSVPVMYNENRVGSNAITDRVQVYSRPMHANSLENIVKQVVEEVTKRKVCVITESTAGYVLNL
ncbi:hypothetical protein CW713_11465 [Methanophagales archaeon]|nr:MAG: hypothetical protein CW713_11465 [Methanophagales archaeon]